MDTRKHTGHVLAPESEMVEALLRAPTDAAALRRFQTAYRALLQRRFAAQRERFDVLAEQARRGDVYLGCSCPTSRQPDVHHCHTVLALAFMQARYPDLEVHFPPRAR